MVRSRVHNKIPKMEGKKIKIREGVRVGQGSSKKRQGSRKTKENWKKIKEKQTTIKEKQTWIQKTGCARITEK